MHAIIDNKNKNILDLKNYLDINYKFFEITIQLETIEESNHMLCDNKLI